jgi:hypothetical protein
MNMYFWIEALIVVQYLDRHLLVRQRRSRQLHELALELIAAEQQEEHQEDDHRRLTIPPSAPIEPCHRKLPSLKAGGSTTTRVACWRAGWDLTGVPVVALSTSAAAVLDLRDVGALSQAQAFDCGRNPARRFR